MRKAYSELFICPTSADQELLGQGTCGELAMLFPSTGRSPLERGEQQEVEIDWDNVESSLCHDAHVYRISHLGLDDGHFWLRGEVPTIL